MAISNFSTLNGQSNFDICQEVYGGLDNLVKLLNDNQVATSSNISPTYTYDTNKIINKLFTGINYATGNFNDRFFDPLFFDPSFFE